MNVRELLQHLLDYVIDGRGSKAPVAVLCNSVPRTIERVETRLIRNGGKRPRRTFMLIIADGPAEILEPPPTTTRAPQT